MANIFLIVEGETEEQFYKKTLQNFYRNPDGTFWHYLQVVIMPTKKNLYSRKQKGGLITYATCVSNVKRFLNQAAHCELVVLILDYYGLHPTFTEGIPTTNPPLAEKISFIQERLETAVGNRKFKFRLQVHEFEAYLYSDATKIAAHFHQPEKSADLQAILNECNNTPELINNHPRTAPSKRLEKLFPEFKKTTDGLTIAKNIGIPIIRAKCENFDNLCRLIDVLE